MLCSRLARIDLETKSLLAASSLALALALGACGGVDGNSGSSADSGAQESGTSGGNPDSGGRDAASSGGHVDSGVESGGHSSGPDSAASDAGADSPPLSTTSDGGTDAPPATSDAGVTDAISTNPDSGRPTLDGAPQDVAHGNPPDDASPDTANLPDVTLWVAGDSTVSVYPATDPQQGWGQHLADFLSSKVTVNDDAIPGRTVVTFMASTTWTMMLNGMKPGDFVMIEFGINDSSTANGRLVDIPTFTSDLGMMVSAILAKKATPIMVTPSALQYWVGTMETNAREQPYADAMKTVAMQNDILVDDLNAMSVAYLNMIGKVAAEQIYIDADKAHFTLMGAVEMAKLVTEGLVQIGSPLGAYVK